MLFLRPAAVAVACLSSITIAAAQESGEFAGPYLGLETGIDFERQFVTAITPDIVAPFEDKDTNGLFGINAGYNFQFGDAGRFLAGVEGHAALITTFDVTDRILGVAARFGYLIAPESLIYARAGYANFKNGAALDGYQLGGGYETFIGRNISLKAEYRYLDFEDLSLFLIAGDPEVQVATTASKHNHQVIFGLNWHF